MFDNYRVRNEEGKRKNDGTTATPYKERVVIRADGDGQLVLCEMKGLKGVTEEGDEFAAYLADDQRNILHRGFESRPPVAPRLRPTSSSWSLMAKS